ncbi:hypothetical protein GCM10009716_04670 [Streptomyces sodiiphilus]|uniref:Uncharacterized protein n=1 Tax=Streptomyces sodiiphilus TaxID=226217 RepID=A0ABN2NTI2_9ACTN
MRRTTELLLGGAVLLTAGLLLRLLTGGAQHRVGLGDAGVVLMVVGGLELLYGLYLVVRR